MDRFSSPVQRCFGHVRLLQIAATAVDGDGNYRPGKGVPIPIEIRQHVGERLRQPGTCGGS